MDRRSFLRALPFVAGAAPKVAEALARSRPTLPADVILNDDWLKRLEQGCVPLLTHIEHFQDRDTGLHMYMNRYSDGTEYLGVWTGLIAYAPQTVDVSAYKLPK